MDQRDMDREVGAYQPELTLFERIRREAEVQDKIERLVLERGMTEAEAKRECDYLLWGEPKEEEAS